jgi:hypothetical protein
MKFDAFHVLILVTKVTVALREDLLEFLLLCRRVTRQIFNKTTNSVA